MARIEQTAKRKVQKKYPRAYSKMSGDWYIYRGEFGSSPISSGITPKQAWTNAAKALHL
jgi:hypothetical protein